MKFRTELIITDQKNKIDYSNNILLLGSCFTDNIGTKLINRKFKANTNPFGVLFNPYSISNLVNKALCNQELEDDLIDTRNNLWHSFELHGNFNASTKAELLENGNNAIAATKKNIEQADFLFVTFGTAWVYEYKSNGQIVANCHKFSNSIFKRSRLTVAEIVTEWDRTLRNIMEHNPNINIVFTVSPIRHLKDGLHENQLSKATLHLAIEELIQKSSKNCSYFPSYEIILDDLRDYRFFQEDLVHISNEGVTYLFDKFQEFYFDKQTIQLSKQIFKITTATQHRIINESTQENKQFAKNMLHKTEQLQQQCPTINLELEIEYFNQLLK